MRACFRQEFPFCPIESRRVSSGETRFRAISFPFAEKEIARLLGVDLVLVPFRNRQRQEQRTAIASDQHRYGPASR